MNESLILEHLRHIRDRVDRQAEDMREVKERLGILVSQIADLSKQFANLPSRIDRLDARIERIERRLDLQGEPA